MADLDLHQGKAADKPHERDIPKSDPLQDSAHGSSPKLGRFQSRPFSPFQAAYDEQPAPRITTNREVMAELDRVHGILAPRMGGGSLVGNMSLVSQAAQEFFTLAMRVWPSQYSMVSEWALTIQKWAYRQWLTPKQAEIAMNEVQATFEAFMSKLDDMGVSSEIRAPLLSAFAKICEAVKADIKAAQAKAPP